MARSSARCRSAPVATSTRRRPVCTWFWTRTPSVIMDSATVGIPKGNPDYYYETVAWDVRISWSGEYVHAAPWSMSAQGQDEREPRLREREPGRCGVVLRHVAPRRHRDGDGHTSAAPVRQRLDRLEHELANWQAVARRRLESPFPRRTGDRDPAGELSATATQRPSVDLGVGLARPPAAIPGAIRRSSSRARSMLRVVEHPLHDRRFDQATGRVAGPCGDEVALEDAVGFAVPDADHVGRKRHRRCARSRPRACRQAPGRSRRPLPGLTRALRRRGRLADHGRGRGFGADCSSAGMQGADLAVAAAEADFEGAVRRSPADSSPCGACDAWPGSGSR